MNFTIVGEGPSGWKITDEPSRDFTVYVVGSRSKAELILFALNAFVFEVEDAEG
jgi:hypothetical protein